MYVKPMYFVTSKSVTIKPGSKVIWGFTIPFITYYLTFYYCNYITIVGTMIFNILNC